MEQQEKGGSTFHGIRPLPALQKTVLEPDLTFGMQLGAMSPEARELFYFLLFFPTNYLRVILKETNKHLETEQRKPIDGAEFFAFLGVFLLLADENHARRREAWMSGPEHCSIIKNTMSRTRFEEIWACLQLWSDEDKVRGFCPTVTCLASLRVACPPC